MIPSFSISFGLLVLVLGIFIGSVLGSLLEQVFGVGFLAYALFRAEIADFYIIERLIIAPSPGSFLGFLIAVWALYKKSYPK